MVMMSAAADCLGQVRDVGKLPALRGVVKIRRQLVELVSRVGIAVVSGRLRGILQVAGDLAGDLLVLRGVGFLQLLQSVQQLGEWGELAAVGLLRGRCAGGGDVEADILQGIAECRLQVITAVEIQGTGTHAVLIGTFRAVSTKF